MFADMACRTGFLVSMAQSHERLVLKRFFTSGLSFRLGSRRWNWKFRKKHFLKSESRTSVTFKFQKWFSRNFQFHRRDPNRKLKPEVKNLFKTNLSCDWAIDTKNPVLHAISANISSAAKSFRSKRRTFDRSNRTYSRSRPPKREKTRIQNKSYRHKWWIRL